MSSFSSRPFECQSSNTMNRSYRSEFPLFYAKKGVERKRERDSTRSKETPLALILISQSVCARVRAELTSPASGRGGRYAVSIARI